MAIRISKRLSGPADVNACTVFARLSAAIAITVLVSCGRAPETPSRDTRVPEHQRGSPPALFSPPLFTDITDKSRVDFKHQLADGKMDNIMESDGAGGTVLDFDGDGWMDVYLVNSGPAPVLSDAPPTTPRWPNRLFRNLGDGTFEDVTVKAGVAGHGFGTTAAAGDYDNDGYTDLLVVNFDGLILYRNLGGGTFSDETARAGLASKGPGISATFFDANADGFLDVFIANYLKYDPAIKVPAGAKAPYPGPLSYEPVFNNLYRNSGDGTFEDVSESSGIRVQGHRAMSVATLDFDLDGDADLYISNDGTPNLLLANDGKGHFTDMAVQAGVGLNQFGEAAGSMGAAVGDCNSDGLPDLFVTRFGNASLYYNSRGGFFEDRIQSSGILQSSSRYTGWGGNFIDFDNDGDLDLLIVNGDAQSMRGMPALLMENDGAGSFQDSSAKAGAWFGQPTNARGSVACDFDNDGRQDILVTTLGGPAVLLRNTATSANAWLALKLEGTRSNRDGFGAQVRVTAAGRTHYAQARCPTSYVSQQDARLHFGLGQCASVERIEILWLSGQTQKLDKIATGQVLAIREPGESRWPTRK